MPAAAILFGDFALCHHEYIDPVGHIFHVWLLDLAKLPKYLHCPRPIANTVMLSEAS